MNVPDLSKDTIHDKTTDKMFDAKQRHAAEKKPVNTLSKLHRPAWMPPPPIHRKVIDVAPGVKVRSFYDGELK